MHTKHPLKAYKTLSHYQKAIGYGSKKLPIVHLSIDLIGINTRIPAPRLFLDEGPALQLRSLAYG